MLKLISRQKGAALDLNPLLAMAMSNVICRLMMSVEFKQEDSRFQRFMNLIEEGFRLFGSIAFVNFVPAFRYLPGLQATRKKIAQVLIIPV